MISEKESKRISTFLSLVLRHQPETIEIELDKNGWTDVTLLIQKMNANGFPITIEALQHVVATNIKQRFSFTNTYEKIRANQGHSIDVELSYVSQQPPDILYHGTGRQSVASIQQTGLDKRERHHVHLSIDIQTAMAVGQRHGKPFVFEVAAGQMFSDQYLFYLSRNGVWLTDYVPAKYLYTVPVEK